MEITMLKSKLHSVIVTEANINYKGSITIDVDLMEATGIRQYEAVHVNNATNGTRIITYVIAGARGSGMICLNGAAALHCKMGDKVHILSYANFSEQEVDHHKPKVIITDLNNKIIAIEHY